MKRILLYNPPGGLWARGEARCEQNLDLATAYTATAPTTMAYMAAIFREAGHEPLIVDCPVEGVDLPRFLALVQDFKPDLAVLNASVLNLKNDLEVVARVNAVFPVPCTAAILPYFNHYPMENITYEEFSRIDFIVTCEMEAAAYEFSRFLAGELSAEQVRGVIRKDDAGRSFVKNAAMDTPVDLEGLPFPARDLLKNELYLRPDNGKPMATIVDGRGCPSQCIYCLAPITTGRKVRKRSFESVVREMKECRTKYGIRDFLFRADTFTINKRWVLSFCELLRKECPDVRWAANSRTNTFDEEIARAMKDAGCFLVEFGIESGSDESLKLQKKGTTTADGIKAVKAARQAGLLTYGTVLVGFPWEDMQALEQTERFVLSLGLNFIEVGVCAPFYGTEFYAMAVKEGLLDSDSISHDMVRNPAIKGTRHVSREELLAFRQRILKAFYMRPSYILSSFKNIRSWAQFVRYAKNGLRVMRNFLFS